MLNTVSWRSLTKVREKLFRLNRSDLWPSELNAVACATLFSFLPLHESERNGKRRSNHKAERLNDLESTSIDNRACSAAAA